MGRKKTPAVINAMRGNPGKRATNKQAPDPEYLDDLTPPPWLSAHGLATWRQLAPKLRQTKLLTIVDVQKFATGCQEFGSYIRAQEKLNGLQEGKTEQEIEAVQGKIMFWQTQAAMAFKRWNGIFSEFGMSPESRTKIQLQPQTDMFDALLTGFGPQPASDQDKPAQSKAAKYLAASRIN